MPSSMHPGQLLKIIAAALQKLGPRYDSLPARALLLGTAAQESALGRHVRQIGGGPALGVYQMEPATHDDIWGNYLAYKPSLSEAVKKLAVVPPTSELLVRNLHYATAMARVHYLRNPEPLPAFNDVPALARYYKTHYNTPLGAATEAQFIANWQTLIGTDDIRTL